MSLPFITARPVLSVVVPMHDEADNLAGLFERLGAALDRVGLPYEVICIDDGSADHTLPRLKAQRQRDPRVKVISFSRNFGKEVALAAGLRYARGDAVVLMDGDLQHPPELIESFVDRWRQGYQMVYGQRRQPSSTSRGRVLATRMFYRVFTAVTETRLPRGACDFRLIDRRAVEALNALPERTRFTKGLYAWVGFKQISVPFDPELRRNGRSGWSNLGLYRFAIDAITSFSTIPLRIWGYCGGALMAATLACALFWLFAAGANDEGPSSLTLALLAMSFFAGLQLTSLGVIGEYIGRIFTEVQARPLFVVAEELGFEAQGDGEQDRRSHHGGMALAAGAPQRAGWSDAVEGKSG